MNDDAAPLHPAAATGSCLELLVELPATRNGERVELIARLLRSDLAEVRARTLAMAAAVLDDAELAALLRNPASDAMRSAGLEILLQRGRRGLELALRLLDDPDPDVVLLALLDIDHCGDADVAGRLRRYLHHENPNVVQAVIVTLGHLGDPGAASDLLPFLDEEPWLQLAAVQALGDLGWQGGVPRLARMLDDSVLGTLAAESLTRIGGPSAFQALAVRWLRQGYVLDRPVAIEHLQSVAERLEERPICPDGLREMMDAVVHGGQPSERAAAAACLIALGPGIGEGTALGVLVRRHRDADTLPSCLRGRPDLAPWLLAEGGLARSWGFILAAAHPGSATASDLLQALEPTTEAGMLPHVAAALESSGDPGLAATALELFVSAEPEQRESLRQMLVRYRDPVERLLREPADLSIADRLAVEMALGYPAAALAERAAGVPDGEREHAVAGLGGCPESLGLLPWGDWMRTDEERTRRMLVEAACRSHSAVLGPVLVDAARSRLEPSLVRALGDVATDDCVTLLEGAVGHDSPLIRVIALDTLGSVGGGRARALLRAAVAAPGAHEAQVALRALARCATHGDLPLFRDLSGDGDPEIRAICARALGRLPDLDSLPCLLVLAADPDATVAASAVEALRRVGAVQ